MTFFFPTDVSLFQVFILCVFSSPTRRQMCNTNMSVSTDGAVSTSQIPASEQETLVGIFVSSVTFKNNLFCEVMY